MSAKYLIRIDDVCPTMDWEIWNGLEAVLTEMNVKPILAVIPDNRDKNLLLGAYEPRFWDRVRGWQARGWTIGLHGYQHVFQTVNSGIMRINNYSEFAGLPLAEQEAKLRNACDILYRERVTPDLWIAPAHSFDDNTVQALLRVGIRTISDGFALYPYVDTLGMLWVPQQIWRFHAMPVGVWTVCVHYTDRPYRDIAGFRRSVEAFRPHITSFPEIALRYGRRTRSLVDMAFGSSLRLTRRSRAGLVRRNKRTQAPAARAAAASKSAGD